MASCPICHGQIQINEQSFGTLMSCPLCNAVFFVGWSGLPELSEQNPVMPTENAEVGFTPTADPAMTFDQNYQDPVLATEEVFPPLTASEAIESIDKYTNQSQESLPLSYDVFIKGLDLPQQIQDFREAIQDGRFGWEPESIVSQIQNGELSLYKLSPVKASILIQRIRYADLEITWSQNVLT